MSAIPSTPAAPTSDPAPQQQASAPNNVNPTDYSVSASSPSAETTPTETPAADPRAEITQLATELGLPSTAFEGFDNVEQARSAARFWFERTADTGFRGPSVPRYPEGQTPQRQTLPAQQYQQPAGQQAGQGLNLADFGLRDDEPAAKVIRALEQKLSQTEATTQQIVERLQAQDHYQRQTQRQSYARQFDETIASFSSPEYGNPLTGNQTASQRVAADRLLGIAVGLLHGERAVGNPDPPINVLLTRAKFLDQTRTNPGTPTPPVPTAPSGPAGARNPGMAPPPEGPSLTTKWSQDPSIRAALGLK